ncbi:hypothetical protein KTS45_13430 [Halomicroarcula limicola]|uniref:Uncharacterized protein n=1 Tax=Haloarcula limicola TaxID=1429915 RepID=A0A8J7YAT4_9EURY|nr:hypothetical protein [Halomicroarcula limicola]MBV0925201.1 hypothetical protein [Halomicroarcula limicola]
MGIVEAELATFELSDGTQCRIELNRNDRVHLHVDTVRLDLTRDELTHFVDVVSKGKDNLVEIKEEI